MNWIEEAKKLFRNKRPNFFTEENPLLESFDHNETLLKFNVDSITIEELGNQGWDPICFINDEGYLYYFPAFIRLCVNSNEEDYYIGQFLFHITYEGLENERVRLFNKDQKFFFKKFLIYLYNEKTDLIQLYGDEDYIENALFIIEKV